MAPSSPSSSNLWRFRKSPPFQRELVILFFWPNQGSRYSSLVRGHCGAKMKSRGAITELASARWTHGSGNGRPKGLGWPRYHPQQKEALCSPPPPPFSLPSPPSPFPGLCNPALSLQGEGSYIKVLFSALCSSGFFTLKSGQQAPHHLCPHPCQMHQKPETGSALLSLSLEN